MTGISKEERKRKKAGEAAKTAVSADEIAEEASVQPEQSGEPKVGSSSDAQSSAQDVLPEQKDEVKTETEGAAKAPAATSAAISGGDVLVYCKLPKGMKFQTPVGEVSLNGSLKSSIVGGYGCTAVRKDAWEFIQKVYGTMKVFDKLNPVIFAATSAADGESMAKEFGATVKTGLEKKNPNDIITTAERRAGVR